MLQCSPLGVPSPFGMGHLWIRTAEEKLGHLLGMVTIVEFVKKKKKKKKKILAPCLPLKKISWLQCVVKKFFQPKEKSCPPCLFNGISLRNTSTISTPANVQVHRAQDQYKTEESRMVKRRTLEHPFRDTCPSHVTGNPPSNMSLHGWHTTHIRNLFTAIFWRNGNN